MFLSIDIEGGVRHGQRLNEVGISILNTASLNPISPETESPILSYNFRLRSRSRYVKHSNPFLFGTTEDIPLDQTKDLFRRIALGGQHPNPFYKSDGVEIVLAGPRVTGDMRIMNRYIPGLWQNAPIAAVIDLHVLHGGIRLAKALDGLNIEKGQYIGLHCGGNDANYCLRAPLLTAVKHFESDIGGALIDQERAGKIRAVALGTAPSLTSELDQKGKKWYNAGDIEESLDVLGIGWSNLIFDQERKDFL
jgi:hypothetical protein